MPLNVVFFGRRLELIFPSEHTRLGSEVFRLWLISPFHPDSGEARVDVDIVRAQCMSCFARRKCRIVIALGKVNFGQRMPCLERLRVRFGDFFKFLNSHRTFTKGEIQCGIVDLVLEGSVAHNVFLVALWGSGF